jgi:hypothetical protein
MKVEEFLATAQITEPTVIISIGLKKGELGQLRSNINNVTIYVHFISKYLYSLP